MDGEETGARGGEGGKELLGVRKGVWAGKERRGRSGMGKRGKRETCPGLRKGKVATLFFSG